MALMTSLFPRRPSKGSSIVATQTANKEHRQSRSRSWLALTITPTLGFALTITITAIAASYITANYFGPDGGWSVFTSEVRAERKVTIDQDLEVSRDIILGDQGSVIEMQGVDCSSEPLSAPGSGRLCFDESGIFMVSEDGGAFVPMLQPGPPGEDGRDGTPGVDGLNGRNGADGLNCWDTNGNGRADPGEDFNQDGRLNAGDCRGIIVVS
jgi:hypothetical protein